MSKRANPDVSLRDLERLARQDVEAFGDYTNFLKWADRAYQHGSPIGRLLRLFWMTTAVPNLANSSELEGVYSFLRIPHTRGPKIPKNYSAVHVYEGIEIPVRAAGPAQRIWGKRVTRACTHCEGTGKGDPEYTQCYYCKGKGVVFRGGPSKSQFGHRVNVVCPICGPKGTVGLGRLAQHLEKHLGGKKVVRGIFFLERIWGQSRYSGYGGLPSPTYVPNIDFGPVDVFVPEIEVRD